jgi:hypothetical protein
MRRPLRAASRRKAHIQERWRFYRTEWGIEREIETIIARDRLLVAGPWLSEVGFETLYWVPFLHWLKVAFHVDSGAASSRSRAVASARGTREVADRYVEIWDDMEPVESRAATPSAASPSTTSRHRSIVNSSSSSPASGDQRLRRAASGIDVSVVHTLLVRPARDGFMDAHCASR